MAGADGGGQEARRAGEGTLPAGSLGVHHFQLADVDFLLPITCHCSHSAIAMLWYLSDCLLHSSLRCPKRLVDSSCNHVKEPTRLVDTFCTS